MGLDFIICDHHLPGEALPAAVAVLDPKRPDCHYPYPDLSGCGVGFKLMQAYTEKVGLPLAPLYAQLDLVAVSIAADVVPVTGENRILAAHGLRRFNVTQAAAFAPHEPQALASADTLDGPVPLHAAIPVPLEGLRPGLAALHELASPRQGPLSLSSIVFGFAPRINAAGRMGDAHRAVNMLLAPNQQEARYHRRGGGPHEPGAPPFRRPHHPGGAGPHREADPDGATAPATVLYQAHWPQGVLGIVASRCLDQYYRPTVILTERDGLATGSARSVAGFDVHEVLEACAPLLRASLGATRPPPAWPCPSRTCQLSREQFMREVAARRPAGLRPMRPIDVDGWVELKQLTEAFLLEMSQLEPYGPGNPQPIFASTGLRVVPGSARPVGVAGHLKVRLTQPPAVAGRGGGGHRLRPGPLPAPPARPPRRPHRVVLHRGNERVPRVVAPSSCALWTCAGWIATSDQ